MLPTLSLVIITAVLCSQGTAGQDTEACTGDNVTSPEVCFLGSRKLTNNGNSYQSYQGIPYAVPPVGDLRFKSPQAYQFQNGEKIDVSATFQVVCPQLEFGNPLGDEDCLKLNVYVPDVVDDLLPVMVWIHGGALEAGSNNFADYGPLRFLDNGVLVVTINYRLGPFGFLSLGNDIVPGNAGLLDQRLALQWVQDNIASFNGDSDKVTVFGESAGSASIAYHLLSPRSKGLFQRGILQSGSTLGLSWGRYIPADKAVEYSNIFASNLLCSEGDLSCLQSKEMAVILAHNFLLDIPDDALIDFGSAWMPVMDADFSSDPFLPGNPQDLMNSNEFNSDVEMIIGSNRDEGILWMFRETFDESMYETMAANWDLYGPMRIFNIANPEDITAEDIEKARKILEFYTGDDGNFDKEHYNDLVNMFTDSFVYGVYETMGVFVSNKMNVFHYILTHEGPYSYTELYGLPPLGVCHADDLIYLFEPVFGNNGWDPETHALTGDDLDVSNFMVSAWANFAAFGDPTPPFGRLGSTWLPIGPDNFQYMNISGPSPQMDNAEDIRNRMEFWANLMTD